MKVGNQIVHRLLSGAVGVVLFTGVSLRAEEKMWSGAVDASWLNGGNWLPSALLTDMDSVLYDSSSVANLDQFLDQNWSIAGLRVTSPSGPITIQPGFTLTNTAGIDMSAATADLTILADYRPVNNGTLNVAAGRTLTLSNILANINNTTTGAMAGSGTVRILGNSQRLTDQLNAITVIVDGGRIIGNPPVRLMADSGSTVTVIVTNNGRVDITSGSSTRIHLGNAPNVDSTNHFILNGGSVTVSGSGSSGANGIFVASSDNTVGILDINDGTIDLSDRQTSQQYSVLRIGNGVNSRGIVNLNAKGRLNTPRIDRTSGHAVFNFNGGYLEMTQTRDDYFLDVDEVNILEGGATFDTGGRICTAVASLAGPGGLTKSGSGSLTIAGTNTYTGPTVISNGTFTVALPMSSSSLVLGSNVTLNINVGTAAEDSWSPSSVTLENSNTLNFIFGGTSLPSATLLATATLNADGTNFINIAGTGWPAGTTRLIDYDSINGNPTFVFGELPIGVNGRLTNNTTTGSIDLVISTSVNSLEWYGINGFGSIGGLWDIATTLNWNNGANTYNEYGTGTDRIGDTVRFTPAGNPQVEIAADVRPSSVEVSNLNNTVYSFFGPGKITGPTSLVKDGVGANSELHISMVNDYTGGTFIRVGNLILEIENGLPANGVLYVGSPGNPASFTLNGFNQTVAGIVSTGSGSGTRRVLNNSLTPVTLTIDVPAGQTNVYNHTMGNPNTANTEPHNNFSVVKAGPGVQSFSNTGYGGTTTISGGTLLFNGNSGTMTGTVTVQAGGAVGGNSNGDDVLGCPIIVENGGQLQPGNLGVGNLYVSNTVTLQGEAVMEINATGGDRLTANLIELGGTLTVVSVADAPQAGTTFTLFNGPLTGSFSSVVLPPLPSGLRWNTNNLTVNGTIMVEALPRPSFNAPTLSGNELVLGGTGGTANATYYVLTSMDVATPLTNWTVVATNTFDASGAFSFTNVINPDAPQQFFLLQTP